MVGTFTGRRPFLNLARAVFVIIYYACGNCRDDEADLSLPSVSRDLPSSSPLRFRNAYDGFIRVTYARYVYRVCFDKRDRKIESNNRSSPP